MRRWTLFVLAAPVVTVATLFAVAGTPILSEPAAAARAASCTPDEKAKRVKALRAFTRTKAAKRTAYFQTHKSTKARTAFVKRQKATLKRLQTAARCQVQEPPSSPPPAPPPPPAPGAPATYIFGSELSSQQQGGVRRGLDAAARHYRSALGRELPPFSVWGHADLEAMIRTYAETRPTSLEESRRLWTGGQVGHAVPRKVWLGPAWFMQLSGAGYGSRLKIAAHEAFHLLQYEVAPANLWFGGIDDVRPLGPWWLLEGAAEYFGSLAIVEERVLSLTNVHGQWEQTTRTSAATLRSLETYRGQLNTPGAYDIYALAVRQLIRDRDPKLVMAYFDAVGRGGSWPNAFSTAFGRSVDAFYAEFEAYRRGL